MFQFSLDEQQKTRAPIPMLDNNKVRKIFNDRMLNLMIFNKLLILIFEAL